MQKIEPITMVEERKKERKKGRRKKNCNNDETKMCEIHVMISDMHDSLLPGGEK